MEAKGHRLGRGRAGLQSPLGNLTSWPFRESCQPALPQLWLAICRRPMQDFVIRCKNGVNKCQSQGTKVGGGQQALFVPKTGKTICPWNLTLQGVCLQGVWLSSWDIYKSSTWG